MSLSLSYWTNVQRKSFFSDQRHVAVAELTRLQSRKRVTLYIRAATDESQKTRNEKQETKRFSTFAVYRLRHSETKKKTLLDSRIKF